MQERLTIPAVERPAVERATWRFREILALPEVGERFERVRRWFYLRESTYDVTNRCNLRCDGCYYYEGEKQFARETPDPAAWRKLLEAERARGITYVVLAGAEPALAPDVLQACHDAIPLGCVATNGVLPVPPAIGYRMHVSVWGDDATSARVRGMPGMLRRQLEVWRGDPRAVFVYTFTRENIDQAGDVVASLAAADAKVTFNMFSAPVGYSGPLRHDAASLAAARARMLELIDRHPRHVLFSPYSAVAHTQPLGLHDLFGCSYPRCNPSTFIGLGRSFRQYRTDLSWDRRVSCCVPDTDCADCRHYASGSAVVTARMHRHAARPDTFRAWLDYVDTYLAVWVAGYEKGTNLCRQPPVPPRAGGEEGR
ncbi:MAG: radical SAM protein [Deltaproteobacteria bacterium]|nr:radical SAM protein [Deltaproteobacteria bacterium]